MYEAYFEFLGLPVLRRRDNVKKRWLDVEPHQFKAHTDRSQNYSYYLGGVVFWPHYLMSIAFTIKEIQKTFIPKYLVVL